MTRSKRYERQVGIAAICAGMRQEVGPLEVHVDVWRVDRNRYDVDNLLKAVVDGMVKCKALADDNITVVRRMSIEHHGVDKAQPRVEVRVTRRES